MCVSSKEIWLIQRPNFKKKKKRLNTICSGESSFEAVVVTSLQNASKTEFIVGLRGWYTAAQSSCRLCPWMCCPDVCYDHSDYRTTRYPRWRITHFLDEAHWKDQHCLHCFFGPSLCLCPLLLLQVLSPILPSEVKLGSGILGHVDIHYLCCQWRSCWCHW